MTRMIAKAALALCIFVMPGTSIAEELQVIRRATLSSEAHEYALRYVHSNKIVTGNGLTFAAYLEQDLDAKARTLDHLSGEWSESGKLGSNKDDHGGAALAIDQQGYLHAVFGGHSETPLRYTRSFHPWSTVTWTPPVELELHATYPSLLVDGNGTLHLAYRNRPTKKSNDVVLSYRYKEPNEDWNEPTALASVGEATEYAHYQHSLAITQSGELHVLMNFYFCSQQPHIGARSRHIGYLRTTLLDGGKWTYDEPWRTIAGSPVELPIHPNTPGGAVPYHVDTGSEIALSLTGLALDQSGKPWFVVTEEKFAEINPNPTCKKSAGPVYDRRQFLHSHDGARWIRRDIDSLLPDGVVLGSTPLVTSVSGDDVIYLAGEMNCGVGLLYAAVSELTEGSFRYIDVERKSERSYLGITLERSSGQNAIGVPWMGYGWCLANKEDCHAELVEFGQ